MEGDLSKLTEKVGSVETRLDAFDRGVNQLVEKMDAQIREQHEQNKQAALTNQKLDQVIESNKSAQAKAERAHERIDSAVKDRDEKIGELDKRVQTIEDYRTKEADPIWRIGYFVTMAGSAAGIVYAASKVL